MELYDKNRMCTQKLWFSSLSVDGIACVFVAWKFPKFQIQATLKLYSTHKMASNYNSAAKLLAPLLTKKGAGLKELAFGKKSTPSVTQKSTYAVTCKTLSYLPTINKLLECKSKSHPRHKTLRTLIMDEVTNKALVYVLIYELLFSDYKSLRGGGSIKRLVMKYHVDMKHSLLHDIDLDKLESKRNDFTSYFPKYLRVNTLKTNLQEVVDLLKSLDPNLTFYTDRHVPNLLVLPPKYTIDFYNLPFVKEVSERNTSSEP